MNLLLMLNFSSMLNNVPISEDEGNVSYNVESLFTNIPIKDTIDFVCKEIFVHKKLESIWKKSISKLTTLQIHNIMYI